jgi:hypothetical protein
MNRAAGGVRNAPTPLIVASDAPSATQSGTPASAAQTPEIALIVSAASEDKEVTFLLQAHAKICHPLFPLLLTFFIDAEHRS